MKIRLTKREKALLLLFFVTVALYLFYRTGYRQIEDHFKKKIELEQKRLSLSLLQRIYDKKSGIEDAAKLELKKLPDDDKIADYIINIEGWARAEGVRLVLIKAGEVSGDEVKVLPVEITVEGDKESLLKFLKRIENFERLSKVEKINLVYAELSGFWTLTVTVDLYYFPMQEGTE
ncbi:type 4a pilus biogenesis protein PilO [Thermosediminibacter oceani]|uniref:type 4a pilus biogenesis protein PilO n=1 Tax=Thermosediminibacter oceani TaxID=291990 RepID=UPI0002E4A568|nr:type 4a pilus biogenesis protein PilO [Thermosediminibacter oceani]